jgi:hypothetical protein
MKRHTLAAKDENFTECLHHRYGGFEVVRPLCGYGRNIRRIDSIAIKESSSSVADAFRVES